LKQEVEERLTIGLNQYFAAQASGVCKFAITDAYSAIDNYFSAILIENDIVPSRIHKEKLKLVLDKFKFIFEETNISESTMYSFYDGWLKARYSASSFTPNETLDFLRLSYRIISRILKEIAGKHGRTPEDLEQELNVKIIGGEEHSFDAECSIIHEVYQQRLEELGERGIGSKLGNKMLNPSNFSNVSAFSDDLFTKQIIANDEHFGSVVAGFYKSFLELVDYISTKRMHNKIDFNEIPNFMLSIRLRYHGQTLEEIDKDWMEIINSAVEGIKKRQEKEKRE